MERGGIGSGQGAHVAELRRTRLGGAFDAAGHDPRFCVRVVLARVFRRRLPLARCLSSMGISAHVVGTNCVCATGGWEKQGQGPSNLQDGAPHSNLW
jgi:hypothetical protein